MPENHRDEPTDQKLGRILAGVTPETQYKDLTLDSVKQDNTNYMIYRNGEYITTINADPHKTTDELRETLEQYTRQKNN